MKYVTDTLGYFVGWGTFYGFWLGAWSANTVLPIMGAIFGIIWGLGIGAACGLLCGVLVAAIQSFTFHEDVDLTRYSRRLSRMIGLTIALAAPLILLGTSKGVLWEDYQGGGIPQRLYLVQCLAAASFWGALSSAFVASRYPLRLASLKAGMGQTDDFSPPLGLTAAWMLFKKALNWPTVIGSLLVGMVYALSMSWNSRYSRGVLVEAGIGAIGGLMILAILLAVITMSNGLLLTFLKHLVFLDHESHPTEFTRRLMTLAAVIFTAGLCLVSPIMFFPWAAAPWPILMGVATYRAFPSFAGIPDKTKRKEKGTPEKIKHALALDDETQRDNLYESGEITLSTTTQEDHQ